MVRWQAGGKERADWVRVCEDGIEDRPSLGSFGRRRAMADKSARQSEGRGGGGGRRREPLSPALSPLVLRGAREEMVSRVLTNAATCLNVWAARQARRDGERGAVLDFTGRLWRFMERKSARGAFTEDFLK